MERHLLLTCGDDPSAFFAIRFASNFFRNVRDVRFTLFYVTPRTAPGYDDSEPAAGRPAAGSHSRKAGEILAKARELVLSFGYPADHVKDKVLQAQLGTVEDILNEAEAGLYDAVVLGRRGLSRIEELVGGSVTKTLLAREFTFPIWICKLPAINNKDVLLTVDGSEGSKRVADHVGFILAGMADRTVTMLHVRGTSRANLPGDPEAWFAETRQILEGNGLSPDAIHRKVVTASNAAEAVLAEAAKGSHAAVAVGRTSGVKRPALEAKFMGGTTMRLLRSLESTALWVC